MKEKNHPSHSNFTDNHNLIGDAWRIMRIMAEFIDSFEEIQFSRALIKIYILMRYEIYLFTFPRNSIRLGETQQKSKHDTMGENVLSWQLENNFTHISTIKFLENMNV